jgi:hypothetical protein
MIKNVQASTTLAEMANELLELVSLEDLDFKLKEYYWGFAMAYHRLGDSDSAIQNAEAALQHAELFAGGVDDEFQSVIRGNIAFMRAQG